MYPRIGDKEEGLMGWLRFLLAILAAYLSMASLEAEAEFCARLAMVEPYSLGAVRANQSVDPVSGRFREEHCDLACPGLTLFRVFGPKPERAEPLGPGWWLTFQASGECLYDQDGRLQEIQGFEGGVFHWIRFERAQGSLRLFTDDGREVLYTLSPQLTSVQLPTGEKYAYTYEGDCLTGRIKEGKGYLYNRYNKNSQIIEQETATGVARFTYGPGKVELFDAEGRHLLYRSFEGKLIAIETYEGEEVERIERFFWQGEQLKSYAVLDPRDPLQRALFCRTFTETSTALHGNLTGSGTDLFALDEQGTPYGKGVEEFSYPLGEKPWAPAPYQEHFPRTRLSFDKEGNETRYTYDGLGRLTMTEYPDKVTSQRYDLMDRAVWLFNEKGEEMRMRYNARGQPLHLFESEGGEQSFTYDLAGALRSRLERSADQRLTLWQYGDFNRLECLVERMGTAQEARTVYTYNSNGFVETIRRPSGVVLSYLYDAQGRLARLSSSDHTVAYAYSYDAQNRPTEIRDLLRNQVTTRMYEGAQLVQETLSNGLRIGTQCASDGKVKEKELPDESKIAYDYAEGKLQSVTRITAEGETRYSHRYLADGKEQFIAELGQGSYQTDSEGYRTGIKTPFFSEALERSGGEIQRIETTDLGGCVAQAYLYDVQGQILSEIGTEPRFHTYDQQRNRGEEGSCFNEANQLVAHRSAIYNYDAQGNLSKKEGSSGDFLYFYDALDRLIALEKAGSARVEYVYDAFHRRVSSSEYRWDEGGFCWDLVQEAHYLFDGSVEIGKADASGRLTELRVLGQGIVAEIGAAVAMEFEGDVYLPIHNHRGDVVCLVEAGTKRVVEYARFTAFGEERLYDANGKPLRPQEARNPWRYASKRFEPLSGLLSFGRRFYDPEMGRWISRDPLGRVDGENDYLFVKNNPLALVDPTGLFSLDAIWEDFTNQMLERVRGFNTLTSRLIDLLQKDIRIFTDIRDYATLVGHQLIGPKIFDLIGLCIADPEAGVYGNGEISDKIRVTHVNGIQNTPLDAIAAVEVISRLHGDVNIHYTYRPTAGWTWDFINASFVKMGFISPTAECLARQWKALIQEMGGVEGGGLIIHYAHSLGGAESECASRLLSPEERAMIRIITFGTPSLIADEGFKGVTHYVARLDPVSLFDPIPYVQAFFKESAIIFVGSYWGIPVLDHLLVSRAYLEVLEELGKKFQTGA